MPDTPIVPKRSYSPIPDPDSSLSQIFATIVRLENVSSNQKKSSSGQGSGSKPPKHSTQAAYQAVPKPQPPAPRPPITPGPSVQHHPQHGSSSRGGSPVTHIPSWVDFGRAPTNSPQGYDTKSQKK
ncbi:hypothetical protein MIND_01308000 [Mycena indigotica]|uniref:Uncharacterized protein n=1 Tax=Mycena indigotica TaxID=2126181 RepID=A0A8H6S1F3_9AGAR|nr:uncharacterized protein MIND_01308000 [Mycena indigotica]KAF7290677.1 hypothetical protein MIND_01308000 [Mycena indigotica]